MKILISHLFYFLKIFFSFLFILFLCNTSELHPKFPPVLPASPSLGPDLLSPADPLLLSFFQKGAYLLGIANKQTPHKRMKQD